MLKSPVLSSQPVDVKARGPPLGVSMQHPPDADAEEWIRALHANHVQRFEAGKKRLQSDCEAKLFGIARKEAVAMVNDDANQNEFDDARAAVRKDAVNQLKDLMEACEGSLRDAIMTTNRRRANAGVKRKQTQAAATVVVTHKPQQTSTENTSHVAQGLKKSYKARVESESDQDDYKEEDGYKFKYIISDEERSNSSVRATRTASRLAASRRVASATLVREGSGLAGTTVPAPKPLIDSSYSEDYDTDDGNEADAEPRNTQSREKRLYSFSGGERFSIKPNMTGPPPSQGEVNAAPEHHKLAEEKQRDEEHSRNVERLRQEEQKRRDEEYEQRRQKGLKRQEEEMRQRRRHDQILREKEQRRQEDARQSHIVAAREAQERAQRQHEAARKAQDASPLNWNGGLQRRADQTRNRFPEGQRFRQGDMNAEHTAHTDGEVFTAKTEGKAALEQLLHPHHQDVRTRVSTYTTSYLPTQAHSQHRPYRGDGGNRSANEYENEVGLSTKQLFSRVEASLVTTEVAVGPIPIPVSSSALPAYRNSQHGRPNSRNGYNAYSQSERGPSFRMPKLEERRAPPATSHPPASGYFERWIPSTTRDDNPMQRKPTYFPPKPTATGAPEPVLRANWPPSVLAEPPLGSAAAIPRSMSAAHSSASMVHSRSSYGRPASPDLFPVLESKA